MQCLCRPCHTAKTAQEIQAGRDRAKAQRGSLSRRYRDHEPHPATQPNHCRQLDHKGSDQMNAEDLEAVTAIWASGSSARTTYATQNPPQTPHRHTNPSAEPPCATRAEPPTAHNPPAAAQGGYRVIDGQPTTHPVTLGRPTRAGMPERSRISVRLSSGFSARAQRARFSRFCAA